jgi:hypothetical protein
MLTPLENFYLKQPEPNRSCMLSLRDLILRFDSDITQEWKYGLPFFYYKGKMFCYLWMNKKTKIPYIGIVKGLLLQHPELLQEKRAKMKVLPVDPSADIPVEKIISILNDCRALY